MRKIRGTFNHPATPPTQFMPPPPGVGAPPSPHRPLTTLATLQWGSMLPMCLGCAGLVLPSKSSAGEGMGGDGTGDGEQ